MKNDSSFTKKFGQLFRKLKKSTRAQPPEPLDPIGQLVLSFLQWDATSKAAQTAFDKLMRVMVDYNDLRVSHVQEIIAVIGDRYPNAQERADRLLDALQEIYMRERAMSLEMLAKKPKKEVRAYLDTLPGVPPYVSAQVTLLCFGGHTVPVDDVLAQKLRNEMAVDPEATIEQIQSYLERQIRASDGLQAHTVLRAWVDTGSRRTASVASKTKKKTKKTTKKTGKKTTASKKSVKKKTAKKTKKTTKKKKSTRAGRR